MMKKIVSIFLVSFTIIVFASFSTSPDSAYQKPTIKTIVIDAGHGGKDNGARGDYSFEKDICLDIAMKLGKKMEEEFPDIKILYTRTTDIYPAIKARADFANSNHGDLFVSIHVNAAPKIRHSKFAGYRTQVYYTGKGKKEKRIRVKFPNTMFTTRIIHQTEQKHLYGPPTARMKKKSSLAPM